MRETTSRANPIIFALTALTVLAVMMVSGCKDPDPPQLPEPEIGEEKTAAGNLYIGDELPDFELADFESGETIRLADMIDGESYVAVVFHSPLCPCARNCVNALNDQLKADEYSDLRIVGVVSDAAQDRDWFQTDLKEQVDSGLLPFPVVMDPEQSVMQTYGAERTPTVWLADKEGKIRFYGAPENVLEPDKSGYKFLMKHALDDMREGRVVEVQTFEPIGCKIMGG